MTVKELMDAMIGAYKGFDDEALLAVWPAFKQKLEKFEGKELASAWVEVVSGFDPLPRKPYPLPKDFENVLPKPARLRDSPALDLKGHGERRAKLLGDWEIAQRPAIEAEFGRRVAWWCSVAARDRAHNLAWKTESPDGVWLNKETADKIIEGVVSRDRMDTFGAGCFRGDGQQWQQQMDDCRGHVLAGRFSHDEIVAPVQSVKKDAAEAPEWREEPDGDESHEET